jgi:hypothetical protein
MNPDRILSFEVVSGQRIRIPKSFAQEIVWLKDKRSDVTAKAILGDEGGIYIAPFSRRHQRLEKLSPEAVARLPALSRYRDNLFDVTFLHEDSRFTLGFPKFFRDLDVLPSRSSEKSKKVDGPTVVAWTDGSALEIWKASDWLNHIRAVGSRFDEYIDEFE